MATFIMINLVIAVIVDAMAELKDDDIMDELHTSEDHTKIELNKLRQEINELKEIILSSQKSK
jgi:voltage-gated sodium channel